MAFLLEQPYWPSHFSADKLGMEHLFAAASRRVALPDRML
jgi:hypothetical protein